MVRLRSMALGVFLATALLAAGAASRLHRHEDAREPHGDCTLCQLGLERGLEAAPAPRLPEALPLPGRDSSLPEAAPVSRGAAAYRSRAPPGSLPTR